MAEHAPTTRRALFGGTLALAASAGLPATAETASRLTDWERAEFIAHELGDSRILRLVEIAQRAGWSPAMLCAFAEEEILGETSWLSVQARNHPRHPHWPAVIRHAEREGYEAGEVEWVGAVNKGPHAGRLVCVLECGREIHVTGVL